MKLNQNPITIPVRDVEKSISFYEMLGLKLIVQALPHYARFVCKSGDSTFSLYQSNESGTDNIWIYFETESLDQDVNELQTKGVVFESLPTEQKNGYGKKLG